MAQELSDQKKEIQEKLKGETLKLGPNLICDKDKHEFTLVSSIEAACQKCPLSYPISVGTTVQDGHIYIHGQFVI